jgi:hypothetical protein
MFERIKKILGIDIRSSEYYDQYDIKSIGNIVIPERLTDLNAFILANSVAELNFPIDFYADRISKLRFFIEKNGREYPNSELNRFINNINPLYSFSDLVYQYVFSLLSDGNVNNYVQAPSIYKELTVNNISRWDVLQPDLMCLTEYSNLSTLDLIDRANAIQKAEYTESFKTKVLELQNLKIHNYSINKRSDSLILSKPPLWSANKSVDTLLSVYSARYNVYANNGAAGYLSKKTSGAGSQSLESIVSEGSKRDEILNDINNRNGVTGRRNIWGISGTPIEFVKTLATISELMPFEETLESSIKIAAVFQIPPVLVPRKDQSTYDNQENAERNVWENGILSMLNTVCENLTKLFGIDKTGYKIGADTTTVSCLTQNESTKEDLVTKQLVNLEKLKMMNPELDITNQLNEIYKSYGS